MAHVVTRQVEEYFFEAWKSPLVYRIQSDYEEMSSVMVDATLSRKFSMHDINN